MLFAIKLTYLRPVEEIQAHLEAHKAWLVKYIQSGIILFAGPLTDESGGFILAYGERHSDIQQIVAEDPFDVYRLATFDILGCDPAVRTSDFAAHWASGAKSIDCI
ncbi:hypothetical protein MJP36_11715 [Pseudomonas palleroniana]|uniref:YciI family protein n=1 Tax=Pseudomonas palleroniana TaxID=191390 RepID=UPI001FCBB6BD|nr:YciI family protein [Pseudomonas palleroniana]UOK40480.1 hypothetical protein MJP36_11715 [Pseudomonas palleroniana]